MGMFGFDKQYAMFDFTPVSNQFILEYLPMAKGDFVRVYLYGLLQCYHPQEDMSVAQMSHELNLTEEEIMAAYRHWERMGLVQRISDKPAAYRYVSPLGQTAHAPVDQEYVNFSESLYMAFGGERSLHSKEISMAYEWVADLGLPTEVVLMLIRHMIDTRGRSFSFKAAQKLATELAAQGVHTIEDAEIVLSRSKQVNDGCKAVLRRFSKRREPTMDEAALYQQWIDELGFSPDAIEAACAETTGGDPSFKYLDGILRGIRKRQGRAFTSNQDLTRTLQAEKDDIAPLKELLSIMHIDVSVNDGTRAMYREMRALYPDEVILLAGRLCSVRSKADMTDVQAMLESWHGRGLKTLAEVQEYVAAFRAQNEQVAQLMQLWGRNDRPTGADRDRVRKWAEEYGFSREMVVFCAAYAKDADKPMVYLDKLLGDYHKQGIRTPDQAEAAHAARQPEGKTARTAKVPEAAQYAQREYVHTEDALDAMMAEWKERNGNAE